MWFPTEYTWPRVTFPAHNWICWAPIVSTCETSLPTYCDASYQNHYQINGERIQAPAPAVLDEDLPKEQSKIKSEEFPVQKLSRQDNTERTVERTTSDLEKPIKFKRIAQECLDGQRHDRNIESNTLKLFLKFVRTDLEKDLSAVEGIILGADSSCSKEQFLKDLNSNLSPSINYVKTSAIYKICQGDSTFSKLFRIVFKSFFLTIIHLLSAKKARTNRAVRNDQVRAGRMIMARLLLN